jgi:hypothetical protein
MLMQLRRVAKISVPRLGLALLAGLCGIWPSMGRADTTVYEITDWITPAQRAQHAHVIDRFAPGIPDENIRFRAHGSYWAFIRFEDERVCIEEACLTAVVTRCAQGDCPPAAAVVGPRYLIRFTQSSKVGYFVSFIKRSGEYTTLMANNRFVAAYQGL